MYRSMFNVLLYADETSTAFFAKVYAAILLMNMPNMHLTVVRLKESNDGSMETENNWIDSSPTSPNSDWMRESMGSSDSSAKVRYDKILVKTNEIFSKMAVEVSHHVIYCNPNIPDAVEALVEYATKKSILLIIIGTQGTITVKGLIFGSLAHSLQNRSLIPVLLVKKLPQDFLNGYRSEQTLRVIQT